ncbi:cbb3-type cytochrome oxidase subunit 3 [Vaginella massiliensis]|uniref:cbb3-type cytochrome oxidase subunit 3 n=1 Tax=Vaginella massiliensis TaxID=1816680 RepID=UPI0008392A72|nr:cbb3-type cytochrome c oxidase subunit 3 [Vaginella massiliensis]
MLKYFKESFSDYSFASSLQTISLILFILFFLGTFYYVWKRPKEDYKEAENLPLEEDQEDKI